MKIIIIIIVVVIIIVCRRTKVLPWCCKKTCFIFM